MQQAPDQIDRIVALWNEVRPDLDTSATQVIGRIVRMEYFITRRVLQDLSRHNLNVGEFDVLAALRRRGEPYQLSPNQLQGMVLISSGALTNRINRLEEAGLVHRSPDPDDRRGVIVTLTPKGFQVIEDAAGHHLAAESELLEMLDGEERETLARLLKKMLQAQED
ncbi:MarR family winged helix-turn-helix transcriptional regulator [Chromobacterium alticapitis]|uniref:MarR family transcriptional regulator n=1 Tax=Chromobacterium alticapitis TaxID=2073169 RepID=A0A2S5DLN7_9NEIS|nr:MarR family transcriptional regulator [Chromobacterium alticapitis]POZ63928.1 MarR family transcriptional regulator [Chromobacterium alticapitis]